MGTETGQGTAATPPAVPAGAGQSRLGIASGAVGLLAALFAAVQAMQWQAHAMRTPLLGNPAASNALREESMAVFIPWVIAAALAAVGLFFGIRARRHGKAALIVSAVAALIVVALIGGFTDAVTYGL